MVLEVIIAAILGLLLGSFLSVLLERWETKEGIVAGRSRCPSCMHTLAWYDLVPLLSWVLLRGHCRYCGVPIHWRYPFMEVVMAVVLATYAVRWDIPLGWQSVDVLVLFGLVTLVFFDARWFILPDAFTYGLSGVLLVRLVAHTPEALPGAVGTAVFLAAVFFFLYLVTRGSGVGLGDVKFGFAVGLLFGFPGGLIVTIAAIWAGALVGIGLMIAGKANRKTPMPFGTFWAAAAVLAMLLPEPLLYVSSLLRLS